MWSATPHRGGKMTKSAMATPGRVDLAVSTVKMDGSYRMIRSEEICELFSSELEFGLIHFKVRKKSHINEFVVYFLKSTILY